MAATIGFCGIGNMGFGMAVNLLKFVKSEGGELLIWNRSAQKTLVQNLVKEGATLVSAPSDMSKKCQVVFSMLGSDAAVEQVFDSYMEGGPKEGAVYVECSTVDPELGIRLVEKITKAQLDCGFVTAPVFGRPDAALQGQLILTMAGAEGSKKKVEPYLMSMGKKLMDIGSVPRQGYVMKLLGNFFVIGMSEFLSEGLTLAEKNGVPSDALLGLLENLFGSARISAYGKRIASGDFSVGEGKPIFNVNGGIKDVTHINNLAHRSETKLPIGETMQRRLETLAERGFGEKLDFTALDLIVREEAGLDGKGV